MTSRSGDNTRTIGPGRSGTLAGWPNVRARQRRNAAVIGAARRLSRSSSWSPNGGSSSVRHRSSHPHRPCWSRNTTVAMSPTPMPASSSRWSRLRSGCPLVTRCSDSAVVSSDVHRFTFVRYRRRIRRGSAVTASLGTSASGAIATSVAGSVTAQTYEPNDASPSQLIDECDAQRALLGDLGAQPIDPPVRHDRTLGALANPTTWDGCHRSWRSQSDA